MSSKQTTSQSAHAWLTTNENQPRLSKNDEDKLPLPKSKQDQQILTDDSREQPFLNSVDEIQSVLPWACQGRLFASSHEMLSSTSQEKTFASTSSLEIWSNARQDLRSAVSRSEELSIFGPEQSSCTQQLHKRFRQRRDAERDFVRALTVIFVITFASFIPVLVITLLNAKYTLRPEINISGNLLLFLNNSVNWIVYGAMDRSFRRDYRKYCCACVKEMHMSISSKLRARNVVEDKKQ